MTVNEGTEPVEVARNPWGVVVHHEAWGTLELRWLPGDMTDTDFEETLQLLAGMGERYRSRFMIIDANEFHHELGPGVMQWREENILPRYEAAGVTKVVFLVPASFPGTVESGGDPIVEGGASFPTAWFSTRERAYQWLEGE
jgi:hypothetical protein